MSDDTRSIPTAGVAMTAIGVALIRVMEGRRPDRLYHDPLAEAFVEAARPGFDDDRWARFEALAVRRLVSEDGNQDRPITGLGPDGAAWFAAHGWQTSFRGWDELTAGYGRPVAMNDPEAGNILAVRQ